VVLDGVIGTPGNLLRDLRPLVPVNFVRLDENVFLVGVPGLFSHLWVQMVVPSLSALLSIAIGTRYAFLEIVGDYIPPLFTKFLDIHSYEDILLWKPLMSHLRAYFIIQFLRTI
jgi:hypothetical protein